MQTTDGDKTARDHQLVELASPSEVGLLVLGIGALGSALFTWRRRRRVRRG